MTPLDAVLYLFIALVIVALIVLAASKPRYTWRQIATLEEIIEDMQRQLNDFSRQIGEKLIPILTDAAKSIQDFADTIGKFNHDQS